MEEDLYSGIDGGTTAEGLYADLFAETAVSGHHETYLQHKVNELEELLREREAELQVLRSKLCARDQELAKVAAERDTLLRNISCLFNTAKEEMARKQAEINTLRAELAQCSHQHPQQQHLPQQQAGTCLPRQHGSGDSMRPGPHVAPPQWARDSGSQPVRPHQPPQEPPRPRLEGQEAAADAAGRKRSRDGSEERELQQQQPADGHWRSRPHAEDSGSKRSRCDGYGAEASRGAAAGAERSAGSASPGHEVRRSDGGLRRSAMADRSEPGYRASSGGGSSRSDVTMWRRDTSAPRDLGPDGRCSEAGASGELRRDERGSELRRDERGSELRRDERGSELRRDERGSELRRDERGSEHHRSREREERWEAERSRDRRLEGRDPDRGSGREVERGRDEQREGRPGRESGWETERGRERYKGGCDPRDSWRPRDDGRRTGDPDRR
ncbi:hypothetical protein Agub_g1061 [Astrephomene gubernaculifera]|uniref:Uncharacterized protein n=1 Tax=Astrephomene gubernaculifera TaxID=47775 RepID=A0AAD3DGZ2_9CHLO|nr:hypothetical protein Agub_g1061 [Astrephomene gubernaculifera]